MADSVFVRGGHRTYNLAHQPTCMGSRRRRRRAAKPAPPAAVQPTVATTTPRPTSILLVAALLAIITLTVYAPARHYDFVTLDDPLYVSENPHVAALTPDNIAWAWTNSHGGFWIPLVWMSYMVDVTVFGPGAGGHHITNVALHVLIAYVNVDRLDDAEHEFTVVQRLNPRNAIAIRALADLARRGR